MKKNYNCPETEEVQLNGCSIMQSEGGSPGSTPMDPPSSGDWKAPRKL